jgi:ABC-type Zn uptake system ZnuABC Zn-binding protein ZnuA
MVRRRGVLGIGGLVLSLALVGSACGDDDGPSGASASATTADEAAGVSDTTAAGAATSEGDTAGAGGDGSAVPFTECPAEALAAGAAGPGPGAGEKLQVVTTVAPITSIVANVAGEAADVTGVVPEGTNSHTYEPKPSVAAVLSKADVVFVNGLKLEDPTLELAEEHADDGSQIVELGTLTITPDQYLYDFSFPEDGGKPNPHLWTNPPMARCYAEIAASVLAKADPANAATYQANAAAYTSKIDELDRLMVAATATVPEGNRKLLTYHDAYAYFAQHYGWEVIGAIQVSSFEDPTPKEVTGLIDQVKATGVPAIFGSEVFPSPVLEQIGKETGVRYVDVLRDDDLPGAPGDPEHSFLGLMQFDYVTMVTSLGGDATGLRAFDPSDVTTDRARYPQ